MVKFSINKPDKNKRYTQRIGAYAVITNNENLIAIVKTETGYFLPGGGIEEDESLDECLKRECLEELGMDILIINKFAQGNYYFHSTTFNVDMESLGNFFTCKINNYLDIKTEVDHELVWFRPEKAIKLLYLDNQKESLRIFSKIRVLI